MSDWIILRAGVLCGLACPLHMWWPRCRGREAACWPPAGGRRQPNETEGSRARQERLSVLIASHDPAAGAADKDQAPADAR